GSAALTLHMNGIYSNGTGFPRDFVVDTGSCTPPLVVVPAGHSCEMTVTFRPQLTYRPGERTETYTIATNAGSVSGNNYAPVTFTFSGEATGSPEITIAPPAANFLDTFAGTESIPQ